jgi:hypothetical protein
MLFFKLLFSPKFRTLRNLVNEMRRSWSISLENELLNQMKFFSYIFFLSGFLGICKNRKPAFPNAYKNISLDIFKKAFTALPLYYAFRYGMENSGFSSVEDLVTILSQKCSTLDIDILKHLSLEWGKSTRDELDKNLYQYFSKFGIFNNVFSADEDEVYNWFKNFLNQTYDYVLDFSKKISTT